ncbi:MAG: CBS domain-containing protein [Gammaproteobacteria bacterium]|nr:CBS domain-containing protein [Gammaproteobacteria bacterium]
MRKKIITVRDVMKKEIDIVDGKMTVMEALKMMKHVKTKSLIVQKRDDNDEYGIVLLSDIAKKVLAKDRSPNRVNIFEIMSKPVINIDPNMDIRYCARLFEQFGLARAPVVENRTIIGLISFTDMVMKGLVEFD